MFEVINTSLEGRIFEDYNFGFTIINNKQGAANLNAYLEWLKNVENIMVNRIITMVKGFIGNK